MKTWIFRSTAVIFAIFLLLAVFLGILTQTGTGRLWTEDLVRSYVRDNYAIEVTYNRLIALREDDGYRFGVTDLTVKRIDKVDAQPLVLKEARLQINSLKFWNKKNLVARLAIQGINLDLLLSEKELRIPSLGIGFNADEIKSLLDKFRVEDKGPSIIKEVTWDDSSLALKFGLNSDHSDFQLSSSGHYSEDIRIRVDAGEFDLAYFFRTARTFLSQSKDLGFQKSLDATANLLEGKILKITLQCATALSCQGEIPLRGVTSTGEGWIPGVEGLDASLTIQGNEIALKNFEDQFLLHYPLVSSKPLAITFGPSNPTFTYSALAFTFALPDSAIKIDDLKTISSTRIEIPRDKPESIKLAIAVDGEGADLMTVFRRLPAELIGEATKAWLTNNFSAGTVGKFQVNVDGTLPETPLVVVNADFRRAKLRYLSDWPELSNCQGQFQMRGLEMNIPIKSCYSQNVKADKGHVRIHGIDEDKARIDIDVRANSNVTNAFKLLAQSTTLKSLGQSFLAVPILGRSQSTVLRIELPLAESQRENFTIEGRTTILDLTLDMDNGIYAGRSPKIDLEFDKKGLKNLKGEIINDVDHSIVNLKRDDKANYIFATVEPKVPAPNSLTGHLHLIPASAPDLLTAQLSGYKLKGTKSPITLDSLRWQFGKESSSLALVGRAEVDDFGAISKAIGLEEKFQGGKGELSFDLYQADLKTKLGAESIDGNLKIHIEDGKISELPRTAVALVDFANLNALGISSESLDYKSLEGEILFKRGLLSIKDGEISMGIVDVEIAGDIDYRSDKLNLTLDVLPNLGSPAAAVLIGLWNPLLGLGLFGASQLSDETKDSPLNRVASQTYKIEGSISDSKVHLIRPLNFKKILPEKKEE